ncbi:hypothetical protein V1511DRAFT_132613 [Dipodascopsis uninucleata]
MRPRELLKRYSEVYTVFLPLCGLFIVVFTGFSLFGSSVPIPPRGDDGDSGVVKGGDLIGLHKALIQQSSITGREMGVASFLGEYLEDQGFTVELQPVAEERVNVFAYKGKKRETRILVTSHIDTVPPYIPYSVHDGYIWGRGSVDAKASVAAQVIAVEQELAAQGAEEGDIALLYVVGEETVGLGMETANKLGLEWETVIFGEPTELKLAVGHKGLIICDVNAKGLASHSGYPELGISATEYLIQALYDLLKVDFPKSDLLGNTTLNIGTISAGVASNVLAANGTASIAVRVAADLAGVLQQLHDTVKNVDHVDLDVSLAYEPALADYDVPGFETVAVAYGTDMPHLRGDHKRYLYGPGSILYAHADNERITEAELFEAVAGYRTLIQHSLGRTAIESHLVINDRE